MLRPYQQSAVDSVLAAWAAGVQRPAVVLPCGTGKTHIFAHLAVLMARAHVRRSVVLVNRDELVRQTVAKLIAADPSLSVGVIQGKRNDVGCDLTVASVQTLSRQSRLDRIDLNRFNLLICDEAHYFASDGCRRVMDYFGAFKSDSECLAVGFTATMVRSDKRGLGEIWDEVVFTRDTRWAIEEGHLVEVTAQTVVLPGLDTDQIRNRGGDLVDGELGKAMAQAGAGPLIAAAYAEHARDEVGELRRGIVFAPTIETAHSFARDFLAVGIPTEVVIGTTSVSDRQSSYARTEAGINKVLMSVGVLTTGFDLPVIEVAVMARPTKSRGLYQQCVGRALRQSPATGKTSALILDVVGATSHGLASIIDLQLDDPVEIEEPELDDLDEEGSARAPALRPEAPSEIGFVEVDPFTAVRRRERPRTPWLLSSSGRPFLPSTSSFEYTIFLMPEVGGLWTVGERPKRGAAKRLLTGATFEEAVSEALDSYPGMPPKMYGLASPKQRETLQRFGKAEPDELTKQEASDLLAVCFVDAWL